MRNLEYVGEWVAFAGLVAADLIYLSAVWLGVTWGHGGGDLFWVEKNIEGPLLLIATLWGGWAVWKRGK